MPNFPKATLIRIGRILGGPDNPAPLSQLNAWSGIPRKSFYNWTLEPTDPQYREMPPIAKRLITILAYFALTGQLTEKRLEEITALEEVLGDETDFQKLANRMRNLLKKLGTGVDENQSAEETDNNHQISPDSKERGAEEARAV